MIFLNLIYFLCCITFVFSQDTLKVHKVHDLKKCSKTTIKHNKEVGCRLVDTIVHLESLEGVQILPNQVTVPRCYGRSYCYAKNQCMPVKKHEKKIEVTYIDRDSAKCGWIHVTAHEECKCGCDISPPNCWAKAKIFNSRDCTCKCRNEFDKVRKECKNISTMQWDEENCKCVCTSEIMICTTGEVWIPEECGCRKYDKKH